jgi:hypothetical protein
VVKASLGKEAGIKMNHSVIKSKRTAAFVRDLDFGSSLEEVEVVISRIEKEQSGQSKTQDSSIPFGLSSTPDLETSRSKRYIQIKAENQKIHLALRSLDNEEGKTNEESRVRDE